MVLYMHKKQTMYCDVLVVIWAGHHHEASISNLTLLIYPLFHFTLEKKCPVNAASPDMLAEWNAKDEMAVWYMLKHLTKVLVLFF